MDKVKEERGEEKEEKKEKKEGEKIKVELLQDRTIVWDTDSARKLYAEGYFGKPLGIRKPKGTEFDRPLELSLFETLYLAEKGKIEVLDSVSGLPIKMEELKNQSKKSHDLFLDKYTVYKDLREKGYVVRPGLKFGTHFAVYEKGPGIDHAPFLTEVTPKGTSLFPISLVRAGRLATTVRKRYVTAIISPVGEVKYLVFSWYKP